MALVTNTNFPDLERSLSREYASFFSPMEKKNYVSDVTFVDPLTSLTGIDSYQKNVDMLAGRSALGKFLFEDASIVLHKITPVAENQIQTRWTLQFTFKALPWRPRAKFSGVSIYTINGEGKVKKQEDYWDSINLKGGKYTVAPFLEGLSDLLSQLQGEGGAEMAAPELPFELLRRTPKYEVKRYPTCICATTMYDQRPEGYDRLGSYAGGSNVEDKRLKFFSPTIMKICDEGGKRAKKMFWPLEFALPGQSLPPTSIMPEPTIPRVEITTEPGKVYAILRFELAATEPIVRGFTRELLRDLKNDNLYPVANQSTTEGDCIVGQFDALFSLNKRRNEIWIELEKHDWM